MANALERKRLKQLSALERNFAANFKATRIALELTQEELAEKLHTDRTMIGGLERGEKNPSLHSVQQYADALGIDPVELLVAPPAEPVLRAAASGDDPPDARSVARSRKPRPG